MKMQYFHIAREVSLSSKMAKRMGACLVKGGKIISSGFNERKYSKLARFHDSKTRHAEISALLGVPKDKSRGADVYVYREWKNGRIADSKPCPPCLVQLRLAGVDRVYHSILDGFEGMKL